MNVGGDEQLPSSTEIAWDDLLEAAWDAIPKVNNSNLYEPCNMEDHPDLHFLYCIHCKAIWCDAGCKRMLSHPHQVAHCKSKKCTVGRPSWFCSRSCAWKMGHKWKNVVGGCRWFDDMTAPSDESDGEC
jgi:hypothetical protein